MLLKIAEHSKKLRHFCAVEVEPEPPEREPETFFEKSPAPPSLLNSALNVHF